MPKKEIYVETADPPGEVHFQNGIKPILKRHPSLNIISVSYRVGQTLGQIMVPGNVSSDPPSAIVERQPNKSFPDRFFQHPSVRFINEVWTGGTIIVENLPTGIAVARRYPRLLDALLWLESPSEGDFLRDHSFELEHTQYFKLASSLERLLALNSE